MKVDEFFSKFVEGYLFGDLDAMSSCTSDPRTGFGAVCYPMVATTCAGMELLGGLLAPREKRFNAHCGREYFLRYWNDYFGAVFPDYMVLGVLVYPLARHGIAHGYVAKHGVMVSKSVGNALRVDREKKEIEIDANAFYRDFKSSYEERVVPILAKEGDDGGINQVSVQLQLEAMDEVFGAQAREPFASLPELPLGVIRSAPQLGASGAMGPVPR